MIPGPLNISQFPGFMVQQESKYWKIPPGGNVSWCHSGEKIWQGEEKKGENVKEKERKGKEKGKKATMGVKKSVARGEKNIIFKRGGGINIDIEPK